MTGSLQERALRPPHCARCFIQGAEIANIQNQFSLVTGMCKKKGVARTTHKTGFGVVFFFLKRKKKKKILELQRAENSLLSQFPGVTGLAYSHMLYF